MILVENNYCTGLVFKKKIFEFSIAIPSYEPSTDAICLCLFMYAYAKKKKGWGKIFGCWQLATLSWADAWAGGAGAGTRGNPRAGTRGSAQMFKSTASGHSVPLAQSKEKQGQSSFSPSLWPGLVPDTPSVSPAGLTGGPSCTPSKNALWVWVLSTASCGSHGNPTV